MHQQPLIVLDPPRGGHQRVSKPLIAVDADRSGQATWFTSRHSGDRWQRPLLLNSALPAITECVVRES